MNNISDFGLIIEAIIKVLAWLADILVGEHRSSAQKEDSNPADVVALKTGLGGSESVQPPIPASAAGNGVWAAYSDKQATLGTDRIRSAAQPVSVPQITRDSVSGTKSKRPRWVNDFGPGALGAFLVTLGFLAFGYFVDMGLTSEDRLGGLMVELMCLPVSAVLGALFGAGGALLAKSIARAFHSGEYIPAAMAIASLISGAVTGFLCDGLFLIAAYI